MAINQSYLRPVKKSGTLVANELIQDRRSKNLPVTAFGFGQSPFPPIRRAIEALKASAHEKYYAPVQGIAELRERAAAFHQAAEGLKIPASRVVVADGSKNLLFTAMEAFTKADILIPAPAWVSYAPQAAILGHRSIPVQTTLQGRWRVTPEAMEKAIAQKSDPKTPSILILNHPGNPEGLSYTADELRTLTVVFRKHNALVISDEIYGLLHHEGKHNPLAREYPEGTITTGGLSKWCGAGGWRLGIAMLPEELDGPFKETMLAIASETYSCASTPIQHAACEAYIWDDVTKNYLAHQRRILSLTGNSIAGRLQQAGIKVHRPEGAFYLFLDFSPLAAQFRSKGINGSGPLCEQLLKDTGVSLLYGDVFGLDSEHLSARLAYVDFDGAAALAASEKIGLDQPLDEQFMRQYMANNIRGADQIAEWVQTVAGNQSMALAG